MASLTCIAFPKHTAAVAIFVVAFSNVLSALSVQQPHNDKSATAYPQVLPTMDNEWQREPIFTTLVRRLKENPPASRIRLVRDSLSSLGLPVEKVKQFEDIIRDISEISPYLEYNSTECQFCRAFVTSTQFILSLRTFDQLKDILVEICVKFPELFLTGIKDEEDRYYVCMGLVYIQGRHMAAVLSSNKTTARLCEFQNACPADTKQLSLSASRQHLTRNDKRKKRDYKLKEVVNRGWKLRKEQWEVGRGEGNRRKKAEHLKVLQLTDIHVDMRYLVGSLVDCELPSCCSEEYDRPDNERGAGPYGEYKCSIPPRTIELFLDYVATFIQPDIILYTGDVSGSRVWDESQEEVLNSSRTLTDLLARKLKGCNVYPTIGNHEMFPTNLYYLGLEDVKNLTEELALMWSPLAQFQDEQEETFKKAAYFSLLDSKTGLRIISYNTQFMYTKNWYNVLNHDERSEAAEMIEYIESEMRMASDNHEKIILIGHHPPNSPDYITSFGPWYQSLVLQYKDDIVLQIGGHRHNDNFHLVVDEEREAQGVLFLSPAMTPGGMKNPGMRVYYLDGDKKQLQDYDQYYLNIRAVTGDGALIEKLYSARKEYDLPNLTPAVWSEFVDRLERDEQLFFLHFKHYTTDAQGTNCNPDCRMRYICNLRHLTYEEARKCQQGASELPSATTTHNITTVVNDITTVESVGTGPTHTVGAANRERPISHLFILVSFFMSIIII